MPWIERRNRHFTCHVFDHGDLQEYEYNSYAVGLEDVENATRYECWECDRNGYSDDSYDDAGPRFDTIEQAKAHAEQLLREQAEALIARGQRILAALEKTS